MAPIRPIGRSLGTGPLGATSPPLGEYGDSPDAPITTVMPTQAGWTWTHGVFWMGQAREQWLNKPARRRRHKSQAVVGTIPPSTVTWSEWGT
eukprot:2893521-Amphidinium_carterae.1